MATVTSGMSKCSAQHLSPAVFRVHSGAHRAAFLPLAEATELPCPFSGLAAIEPSAPRRSFVGRANVVACLVAVEVNGTAGESMAQVPEIGSRVRVNMPVKVYHVPKIPDLDLAGHEGYIKDVIRTWKGKPVSANLPYRVQFELEINGRQVKFVAHLKEGEFEVVH